MTKNELRILEEKIRNIIMKSDRAGSKGNPLHWKMRYVEDAIENVPVYGLLFQFDFPYKKGYSFKVTKEKSSDACIFTLITPEKEFVVRDDREGYKHTSYEMEKIMEKNGLKFAPTFDQDFYNILMNLCPGNRIELNTGMELACIKKDTNGLLLKTIYTGEIFNVSIDNFRNSKEYVIDKAHPETVQELYGISYDSRLQTSNTRIRLGTEDGYTVLQEAESNIATNTVRSYHIGQMILRASKDESKVCWYDSNGETLDRTLVAAMFGWAKNSMAYISNVDQEYWFTKVPDDRTLVFKELNKAAFSQNGHMFLKTAFDYARNTNCTLFASMSGLEKQANGDYDFITYAFHVNDKGKETILKLHYDQNEKVHDMPIKVEECPQTEFLAFYQSKYDSFCKQIEAINMPMVKQAIEISTEKEISEKELSKKVVVASLEKLKKKAR